MTIDQMDTCVNRYAYRVGHLFNRVCQHCTTLKKQKLSSFIFKIFNLVLYNLFGLFLNITSIKWPSSLAKTFQPKLQQNFSEHLQRNSDDFDHHLFDLSSSVVWRFQICRTRFQSISSLFDIRRSGNIFETSNGQNIIWFSVPQTCRFCYSTSLYLLVWFRWNAPGVNKAFNEKFSYVKCHIFSVLFQC